MKHFLLSQNAGLVGLVETKLKGDGVAQMYQRIFDGWCITSNFSKGPGGRILIAWIPQFFHVKVIEVQLQYIHLEVVNHSVHKTFQITVVYGANDPKLREDLWCGLKRICGCISGPWIVSGDFNSPLNFEDRIGNPIHAGDVVEFRECVQVCGLTDCPNKGSYFTWNNKQFGSSSVYSKIDRTMIKEDWAICFPTSLVHYFPEGWFDHCPAVVHLHMNQVKTKRPFKFRNLWALQEDFMNLVKEIWDQQIDGCSMFSVVKKLKMLKNRFRDMNRRSCSDIEIKYEKLKHKVQEIQELIQNHPTVENFCAEDQLLKEFKDVRKMFFSHLQ